MNAEVRQMKTAAEQGLAAEWEQARGRLPGPAKLREAAFRRFAAQGLPHRRVEEWKYTDLRALMRDAKPLAQPPDAAAIERVRTARLSFGDLDCYRAVFVDGHFVAELSDLPVLEDTAMEVRPIVEPMAPCLRHGGWRLAADDPRMDDLRWPMIDLNTAFVSQGLSISVWNKAPGITAKPVHIAHVRTRPAAEAVYVRVLAVTADDTELDLIESFDDLSGAAHQTNVVTEIVVGDRAKVRRVVLNRESTSALHLESLIATLNMNSYFNNFSMAIGGGVSRCDAYVDLSLPGSDVLLGGATLLRGRQHVDNTLLVCHDVERCRSREVFKTVLDGESQGVFQGKIIVRPGAQKTDAKMTSNALLLSELAEADNKPELEIFADDVQCGHGATAGDLDEELLFYLRARGIPPKEAEALLIQAFIGEAIEGIEHARLRDVLMETAAEWLRGRS